MINEKVPGQVKLKGNLMGLPNPSVARMVKLLVPRTGVMMLPKVQVPGEMTAWKCFRHTLKKVLQPSAQRSPLARTPGPFTNSLSSSWKTPEPETLCCCCSISMKAKKPKKRRVAILLLPSLVFLRWSKDALLAPGGTGMQYKVVQGCSSNGPGMQSKDAVQVVQGCTSLPLPSSFQILPRSKGKV